jgi:hypothetical protein
VAWSATTLEGEILLDETTYVFGSASARRPRHVGVDVTTVESTSCIRRRPMRRRPAPAW